MEMLIGFVVSFAASVAAYYVCKWFERDKRR